MDITRRIQTRRKIEGISAVLLPFNEDRTIDLDSFAANVLRTTNAGITPAVNMDTGYTNLLTATERREVLNVTRQTIPGKPFVAGAFVETESGSAVANYQTAVCEIVRAGGTPILFQCSEFKSLSRSELIATYKTVAQNCEKMFAFELGDMFAPFGQIYDLDTVSELMQIPQIVGMKHSSLSRRLELQRLELRDKLRPEFKVYTGNDLAIDMVIYGSDYLLGLSAFSPEGFAARDKLWESGDPLFYELNDLLQYLGFLAFRPPVPAYKHTAAQFLKLRGRIKTDLPHPKASVRPDSDVAILRDISERLDRMLAEIKS
ncbi:MAG: dihydrodipicolinate synthase family protein [Verrucomicrobia bacterium]|nr:dihydrodipicolinate synthase family protein [Verrucomicrobiota bacterium]